MCFKQFDGFHCLSGKLHPPNCNTQSHVDQDSMHIHLCPHLTASLFFVIQNAYGSSHRLHYHSLLRLCSCLLDFLDDFILASSIWTEINTTIPTNQFCIEIYAPCDISLSPESLSLILEKYKETVPLFPYYL